MIKEVPCMECDGKGFIAKFGEYSVWSERCQNCGGTGIVKVPVTNADRIRAMSNEELAEFLILSPEMEFDVCRFCEYGNTSGDDRGICLTKDGICRAEANCAAFKKWLRQPAKEDT